MGSILVDDIECGPDDTDAGGSSGEAVFGSFDTDHEVALMRVSKRDGTWIYADEVTAILRMEARALSWVGADDKERTARWWQIALRTPSRGRKILAGHHAVIALFPYSLANVVAPRFKRGSKKGPADPRRADVGRQRFSDEGQLHAWIEALPNDYWETGNHLVAAAPRPRPIDAGTRRTRTARGRDRPRLVFGLAPEHLDGTVQELLNDARTQRWLALARDNRLRFAYSKAPVFLSSRLTENVKDAAELTILVAIHQALAGPSDDSPAWFGRPVLDQVEHRLTEHLNNHNRREAPRSRRERADLRASDAGDFLDEADEA